MLNETDKIKHMLAQDTTVDLTLDLSTPKIAPTDSRRSIVAKAKERAASKTERKLREKTPPPR